MKTRWWALALLLVGQPSFSAEDEVRSLTVTCKAGGSVRVANTAAPSGAKPAALHRFRRGGPAGASVVYTVEPGQAAECVFAGGRRVRVKVGEGVAAEAGACAGDPEVFASVWIDHRKVVSREWFAGRCRQADASQPRWSFSYDGARSAALAKAPVDRVEYPLPGTRRAPVGSLVLVRGSHKVCQELMEGRKLDAPAGEYDFDNDGKPDPAQDLANNVLHAGFSVPGLPGEPEVEFRGPTTGLAAFRFEDATYLLAEGRSADTKDYRAVVKPQPHGRFAPICLLQRVSENF